MAKSQLNARISQATRTKLDDLTTKYGTQAEVIAVAVDRLWQDHKDTFVHSYQYIEDNAGGLFLFVFDGNGQCVAGIQDLEHAAPGEWHDVKDQLDADPLEAIRTWDGQIDNPQAVDDNMTLYDFGSSVVCSNGKLYPSRMGRSAQRYFGIDAE